MSFVIGFILFAIALAFSIAAHEFGHLLTAKAFGMYARRYFIGFGKKIWSFRYGETEYGLKAIPAGGFVDIAGMSHTEELNTDDDERAFWRYPLWKRTVVMSAGSVTHIVLAVVILYFMAVFAGLPNVAAADDPLQPKLATVESCVQRYEKGQPLDCAAGDPAGPAKDAGLQPGDVITSVAGITTPTWTDVVKAVRARGGQTVEVDYDRNGVTSSAQIAIAAAVRPAQDGEQPDKAGNVTVGVLAASVVTPDPLVQYGPVSAIGGTTSFMGDLFSRTFVAIGQFPQKVPKLIDAISGNQRDPNSPVSVVGASRIGGQAVEAGSWMTFFLLLASFNIFIGIFNILPLLPLDGGHIAVQVYEKVRSMWARARGKVDPGRVDPAKLAPIMVGFILVFGGISALAVLADVVNPIANPFQ